jgi:type I restriction-modification system DNA methylase subunit
VAEVSLEEKIASLTSALRVACASPEDAQIQTKLDQAEQQLNLLQRQYDLDQTTYYSQTNYATDTAGKAKLDAEQQQIQDLQSEIDRLKDELAASNANPSAT